MCLCIFIRDIIISHRHRQLTTSTFCRFHKKRWEQQQQQTLEPYRYLINCEGVDEHFEKKKNNKNSMKINRKSAFKLVVVNFTIGRSIRPTVFVYLSVLKWVQSESSHLKLIGVGFALRLALYTRSICIWNIFFFFWKQAEHMLINMRFS